MIASKSIALYKNRPVLVLEAREKLDIKLEDGSSLKVREKDLEPLHAGPVSTLPSPAQGGDFETARAMAEPGSSLSYAELADLVFGAAGPAEVLACWEEACLGRLFRLGEGGAIAMSDEEVAREAEKKARKEGEAAERASFIERAKKARGGKNAAGTEHAFLPADERFLAEIEALALGKTAKCKLAAEIGFPETPEAAHAFLLRSDRWDETRNPYPSRSACATSAPKRALSPDYADGLAAAPRRDLSGFTSWAIDNAWSHDPDDAVAFDDGYVYIHVADPAAALRPGDPADEEALGRGTTLYLPEGTSPMLPDEALERFGLGLSPTSPALSFRVKVGDDGGVEEVEVCPSTVKVRRTHYAEADSFLDSGSYPELEALARIAEARKARRIAQGAVEISIPEVRVYVREGRVAIDSLPATRSSGIVRELMLLGGEALARWAFEKRIPFPFYSQEAPAEAGEAASGEGLSAQFARRRLMRGGITGPTPGAHRGLGLPFYAQATSPLRRYQDLLGHMQVRAFLEGRELLPTDEVMRRCALAQAASAATRTAERSSELHWTLAWLLQNPGWEGEGVIVGSVQGSSQVYIPALGLETRMKLGSGRSLDEKLGLKVVRIDLPNLDSSFEAL
jgi:exoribonuclease-2